MKKVLSLIVAIMAAGMFVTANAQRVLLVDRSSAAVDSLRKGFSDAEITGQKSFYADLGMISDGNATMPIKAVSQGKGYQAVSFGFSLLGGELFGKDITPTAGINLSYSYRKVRFSVEGTVGIGHPDELSDDQDKFLEFNGFGDLMIELAKSRNLKHQFLMGGYATFKTGKNSVKIEDEDGIFYDKTQAFNFGGGLSMSYIYSPKWSKVYHMVQLRCGLNHKLHTEKEFAPESENTEFSFGGKKAYIQVGVSYKLMFGIGKRHKKLYNSSLRMSEKQINSLVGIK
ncbi:MAG: hypothetical protein MJ212_02840 [Alphaproteobacteria bacterium]|nr:hypothetical protein [Alphaproteobacteria bacterium]